MDAAEKLDSEKIQHFLKKILPTYTPRSFSSAIQNDRDIPLSEIKAEA